MSLHTIAHYAELQAQDGDVETLNGSERNPVQTAMQRY